MFSGKKALERCRELEEQILTLRRDLKSLQLDWENTYDKLRTMMQRIVKRSEAVNKAEEQAAEHSDTPENGAPAPSALSPRQKMIQQQILRRRGGMA